MTRRLAPLLCGVMIAALAAPAGSQMLPPPGEAERISFDVHEGTSMAVSASPDGKMLAIDLQGSLWLVPAAGGRARLITDHFNDARQPAWSPDGQRLAYFAYREGGYDLWTVAADGSDPQRLTDGAYDDREPAWSPDGKMIAFASDRGRTDEASYNIWTLDLATGALRQVTSTADEDRMPTWSPDGKEIAFSRTSGSKMTVHAIRLDTGAERLLKAAEGKRFDAPSWGPGGQLATVVQDATSSRLEIDGKPVSGQENVFPFRISWGKDGSYHYVSDGLIRRGGAGARTATIPFTAQLDVSIPRYARAKRDFDSTGPRRALGIVKPQLSPDGQRLAFVALGDVWLVPVTGGVPENLTKDTALDADVAWSPDGKSLVYTSDKGGGLPQLWIRDLASGRDRQLTRLDTQPLGAAWSHDGRRIAFIDVDGMWGVAGVCFVDVETGKVTRLQASLGQPGSPSWSADGEHVAIALSYRYSASFREGTNQILMIPTDPAKKPFWQVPVPNLSMDTRGGGGPAWSPDGRKMAAIYDGVLKIWPVGGRGAALGPPRSYSSDIAYFPSWAANSRHLTYQSADKVMWLDIETGERREIPIKLEYRLHKPEGRTVVRVSGLIDGVRDATQKDKDIIIEGNRIVAIENADPARARTGRFVDGRGLVAIPGLIEHHAHAQKDFGANAHRAWLAYGITTLRDPGNQPYDGVEDREAAEAGVRVGPRVYTNGPLFEWQRVYYKMGVAVSGPAHLERELERARVLKYDVLKSYVRMPDLYQRRIVEAAHAMGVPVTGHEIYPAAYTGVDATEHLGATSRRGYSPKQGPLARAYEDVIQLFGKSRRVLTPTNFGALVGYLEKRPDLRDDPRLSLYPGWAQASVKRPNPMFAQLRAASFAGSLKAIKAMHGAGTQITAGTDTPIAINLHAEIASYVEAGLTPFQALQAATVTPARALNLDAGTLEPGKLADIVLVAGDPRADISATANTRIVISNGRVFSVDDLLKMSQPPKP
jgi:Tol biopolymer transport system component